MRRSPTPTPTPAGTMGIDPGQNGGLAVVGLDGKALVAMRYPGDTGLAASTVRAWNGCYVIRLCVLEKVASMPRQGVASTFKFGWNAGAWEGILAALQIPYVLVTPQKWMNAVFDSRGKGVDKKARSLELARRLHPDVDLRHKADDGKAEALLMARYARTML